MNSADSEKKTVLVLNGSPKKQGSSTLAVTRAFVDGMCSYAPMECEYIDIADLRIEPCRGCLSCWSRDDGMCVIRNDDIARIREKIENTDYVIESYPLYFFGMPGIMKVFTDRMLGMMKTYTGATESGASVHGIRRERPDQKFAIISSCAYSNAEFVYDSLIKQYDFICGKDNYTAILCPQLFTMTELGTPQRFSRYLKKYEDAGREYAERGALSEERLSELSKPPFSEETYKILLDKFWQKRKTDGI